MKLAFFFRKYHKWLALIVGVQALIWCISGLYMTAVHIDFVHGDHLVKNETTVLKPHKLGVFSNEQLAKFGRIEDVQLFNHNGRNIYLMQTNLGLFRVDANTLEILPEIDRVQIEANANEIYAGEHYILSIELLENYPRELGGRNESIWRVQYDDWLESTLYFSPDTGELRSKRSDLWRWFDFLWMLHIMDYETREETNTNLLRVASAVGLLLTLTGIGLLFYSFKNQVSQQASFTAVVKKIHKWMGLLLGVQLMLWMLSGMMFSLLSHKEVSGGYLYNRPAIDYWNGNINHFNQIASRYDNIVEINSHQILEQPAYSVKTTDGEFLVNSTDFTKINISEALAKKIALKSYAGNGQMLSARKETEKTLENRKYSKPLWQVKFSDEQNASLYLSATTGRVFGVKTDTWRLFDIFWMLHIMDYSERNDMNNSLVIFSVSMISFIALSGIWLVFSVFRLSDFNLIAKLRRVRVVIKSKQNSTTELLAKKNTSLYEMLFNAGFELPSNCGGGGSCGLCKVKVTTNAQVSSADTNLISQSDIDSGYRLACQLKLVQKTAIELPEKIANENVFTCKVISNQFKTPLIKELTLQVPASQCFEFEAGDYVLVHVPEGKLNLKEISVPDKYLSLWQDRQIFEYKSHRKEVLKRAYSMANSPDDNHQIVLNVRLALPVQTGADKNGEIGKVSSYLFGLMPGDTLKVSGSFGNFHALENMLDSKNEMIFIGGGAGMAPLRSHILYQLQSLKTKRRISFWFGARNVDEIFYQQEFDRLAREFTNFNWHISLSDLSPHEHWNGLTGMIHQVVEKEIKGYESLSRCEFYICGPTAMNKAVLAMLKKVGVKDNKMLVDEFVDEFRN